jgi:cyclic 2,3-diphosphoglycerate synthase
VDGEHYPPVVEAALAELRDRGHVVAAVVLAGGREKLPAGGAAAYGKAPVITGDAVDRLLDAAIARFRPESIIDLSDEPVLDYRRRHELVSVALFRGTPYHGADFAFTPPPRPRLARKPSVAVIGTGKRTGKTGISAFAARALRSSGRRPVIVAMGRGGPPDPVVLAGDQMRQTPAELLMLADSGHHAASDYIEDALLARVPTVGCRRCGGGLAGGIEFSNVPEGVELANGLEGDVMLLEGSGSAIPPVHADATALVVPASIPEEYLFGYLGRYRLLLADFVLVTMAEYPFASPSQISQLAARIADAFDSSLKGVPEGGPRVIRTVFRPTPVSDIDGASVVVATTAPTEAGPSIRDHLEASYGCRVVRVSHALSDRGRLQEELEACKEGADVLLCELKAAAVDVATRWALDAGLEVVYLDNVPQGVEGDDPSSAFEWAAGLAHQRFEKEPV